MKLVRVGKGFGFLKSGFGFRGWFGGKSIKGYHKDNGARIGYRENGDCKRFYI